MLSSVLKTWSAGIALGVGNSVAAQAGGAFGASALAPGQGVPLLEVIAAMLGTPWAWFGFAYVVGRTVSRRTVAGVAATGGLVAATAAYYVADAVQTGGAGSVRALDTRELLLWTAVSLLTGPLAALVGGLSRRPGPWGWGAVSALPVLMVASALIAPTGSTAVRPTVVVSTVLLAAVTAFALLAGQVSLDRSNG